MKFSKPFTAVLFFFLCAAAAQAAVNAGEPAAVGTDDGIRVEARLLRDTIGANRTIGITYQIRNLTGTPVSIAEKRCFATYDRESRTIMVSIGSEIPDTASLERLTIVPSGAERTFFVGTPLRAAMSGSQLLRSGPRYVQIRVNVLREWITPPAAGELFERWLESNVTIMLNALPIHYAPSDENVTSAEFQ